MPHRGLSRSAVALALLVSTAGCIGGFEDDDEPYVPQCYNSFFVERGDTQALLRAPSDATTWQITTTLDALAGGGADRTLQLAFLVAAATNAAETSDGQLEATLTLKGAAEPWARERIDLTVSGPTESFEVVYDLGAAAEEACPGQDTCALDFELSVRSVTSAVVVVSKIVLLLRSTGVDEGDPDCGITEPVTAGGPPPLGGSGTGTGGSGTDTGGSGTDTGASESG